MPECNKPYLNPSKQVHAQEVPEMPPEDTCITCGNVVNVPGRDMCFACYSDTEGRGD